MLHVVCYCCMACVCWATVNDLMQVVVIISSSVRLTVFSANLWWRESLARTGFQNGQWSFYQAWHITLLQLYMLRVLLPSISDPHSAPCQIAHKPKGCCVGCGQPVTTSKGVHNPGTKCMQRDLILTYPVAGANILYSFILHVSHCSTPGWRLFLGSEFSCLEALGDYLQESVITCHHHSFFLFFFAHSEWWPEM